MDTKPPRQQVCATRFRYGEGDCAPGMVFWVLASHNRRRALIRVPPDKNTASAEKLYGKGCFLACQIGNLSALQVQKNAAKSRRYGGILGWFRPQAPLQFLAQFRNFHSSHDDEFAAEHFARLVVVRQLAGHAAILAILVPAEAAIGNRFRANELETTQQ